LAGQVSARKTSESKPFEDASLTIQMPSKPGVKLSAGTSPSWITVGIAVNVHLFRADRCTKFASQTTGALQTCHHIPMTDRDPLRRRHRFPAEIIAGRIGRSAAFTSAEGPLRQKSGLGSMSPESGCRFRRGSGNRFSRGERICEKNKKKKRVIWLKSDAAP
jgi:hypothetical protein